MSDKEEDMSCEELETSISTLGGELELEWTEGRTWEDSEQDDGTCMIGIWMSSYDVNGTWKVVVEDKADTQDCKIWW